MEKNTNQNIKEKILNKIKSGDIEMKSKAHFVLKTVGIVIGVLFAFGALLYIVSFILFALRMSGALALPSFGLSGFFILFSSLPWILIVVAGFLIVVVEVLGRHFSFVYRQPFLYSIIAIVITVSAIGILVDKVDIHPRISRFTEGRNIPGGSALYRGYGKPTFEKFGIGVVIEIITEGYVIEVPRGESWRVIVNKDTRFLSGDTIIVGNNIIVVGTKHAKVHTINAEGIRLFDGGRERFQPRGTRPY